MLYYRFQRFIGRVSNGCCLSSVCTFYRRGGILAAMNFAMDRPIVVVLDKLNALKVSDKTLGHILVDTLPAKQAKLAKLWNEWNKHNTNNVLQQPWEYKVQIDKFF